MKDLPNSVKRNIKIYYLSEISRAAIFFQTPIWFSYESSFLTGDKIAFYGALILIFDVLFQIPTGAFADIFGKKLTLIVGNIMCFIGPLIMGLFPTEAGVLSFTFFYGLGTAFLGGTYSSLLYNMLKNIGKVDLYPHIKASSAIRFQWFGSIFLVIGGYAYSFYKPLPYFLFAFGSLMAGFSNFFLTEFDRIEKEKFNIKSFLKQNILGFKEIFKNRQIAILSLAFIFMGAIAYGSQRFLAQPYMSELGLDEVAKGWYSMGFKVLASIIGFYIIKKTGLVKRKFYILIIPVVMVLSMVPARYFQIPISAIFILGIAFASANADLFMSPLVNANLSSEVRTSALSAINMLTSIMNSIIQIFAAPYLLNAKVGEYYQLLGVATAVIIIPMMLSLIRLKKGASADLSLVGD